MSNEDEYAEIKVGRRGGKGQGAREQKEVAYWNILQKT